MPFNLPTYLATSRLNLTFYQVANLGLNLWFVLSFELNFDLAPLNFGEQSIGGLCRYKTSAEKTCKELLTLAFLIHQVTDAQSEQVDTRTLKFHYNLPKIPVF